MAMAICPACDAEVEVDELDADTGDELSCPECGQNLVVNGTDPIELDVADDDDDEDEEDDEDAVDEPGEDEDADPDDEEDEEQEDGDLDE